VANLLFSSCTLGGPNFLSESGLTWPATPHVLSEFTDRDRGLKAQFPESGWDLANLGHFLYELKNLRDRHLG
jgi:hypothetical protein